VRLVSACDKLHNARSVVMDYRILGEALWSRFTGGRSGTLWYYRAMANALRAAGVSPVVEELERVVTEMERLAGSNASA
jgi:GTP pyrophosphokinase